MEKYISNNLSDFEFHDACVNEGYIDENKHLTLNIKYLNIHKNIEQNPHNCDMEIDFAHIVFDDFKFISFKGSVDTEYDNNGHLIDTEKTQPIADSDGLNSFLNVLKDGFSILYLSAENSLCYLEGFGLDPYFILNFSFSKATVSWEKFMDEAWYEKTPFKK